MDNPGTEHRFRIMCMKYSRGRIHKRGNRRCAGFQLVPVRTLHAYVASQPLLVFHHISKANTRPQFINKACEECQYRDI